MSEITTPAFKLFVYGTLKRGHCRGNVMETQKFIRKARTKPEYALLDLRSYPGLVRLENDGRAIEGELYEVNTPFKERLDRIEGSPFLFRLERVELEGEEGPIYSYFYMIREKEYKFCENNKWEGA